MSIGRNKIRKLRNLFRRKKTTEPAAAYDIWASTYDGQKDNPIAYLNGLVFSNLLDTVDLEGKTVVDIGCGTGSNWEKILAKRPSNIIGYDVSSEMLNRLRQKYPLAATFLLHDNKLKESKSLSCDMIVSTLVIGYIKDLPAVLAEWNRVLKAGGEIIITDFHPIALQGGGKRSFTHEKKLVYIKNYIHPLDKIRLLAKEIHWQEIGLIERKFDESIKFFFEEQHALHVYEKEYGTPILYGWHFRKR